MYSKLTDTEKQILITQLYIEEQKSFQEIALLYDTYANKIRRDAKRLKIPARSKSEAQKNALVTGKHKHPTKGTQRSEATKQKIGLAIMEFWEDMSDHELNRRKEIARQHWNNLTDDQKQYIQQQANNAVRESSKNGSKMEKFVLEFLLQHGYHVDFHKEQALSNTKLQIDLFLPKNNIAIEVDGPSHFLPVWGDDTLDKNIKYDHKKTGLILGKGLVLIRIKQMREFSRSRASIVCNELLEHIIQINNKYPDKDNRYIEIGD